MEPQKWKKIKKSQPQTKFIGSYKKKSVNRFLTTEAVLEEGLAERCSVKKEFLKTSQSSQKNNCTGISFFNKVAGLSPSTLLKERYQHRCLFSCTFCEIFRKPLVATSALGLFKHQYRKLARKLNGAP